MRREYDLMIGLMSEQVVAYRPALARALGGVNCALLFQQIAFQAKDLIPEEAGFSAWVYKTRTKMERETAMGRYEQETARRKLRALGVLEEHLRGAPARMHYRINWDRAFELLREASSVGGNPTNLSAGSPPTSSQQPSQQEWGDATSKVAQKAPTIQRGSKEGEDLDLKTDAEIAREDYQDQLDYLSALDHDHYQQLLGRDLCAGAGEALTRFHLSEDGDLSVYEGGGYAPEHRRLVGSTTREPERRSRRRRRRR